MITLQKFFRLTFFIAILSPLSSTPQTPDIPQKAYVRTNNDLCPQEKDFLLQRIPNIKKSLEAALNMPLRDNQVPRIALCASGGGFRAMVATLGWLQGDTIQVQTPQVPTTKKSLRDLSVYIIATISGWLGWGANEFTPNNLPIEEEPLNLRNLCTYFSTLSGSTWALAGLEYSYMTPAHYLQHITPAIAKGIVDDLDMENLMVELLRKEKLKQNVSFIDIYGAILAQKLLSNLGEDQPSSIDLAAYSSAVITNQYPLLIQSCVIDDNSDSDYRWAEFSPYEVGCSHLHAFVPTWAFGRTFNNGISTNFAPPQSLGFCMGLWGSAMSLDAKEFFKLVIEPRLGIITSQHLESEFSPTVASGAELLTSIQQETPYQDDTFYKESFLDERILASKVFNWAFGLKQAPFNTSKTLTLIDAGIDCNLPVQPLLRPERDIDIIIILDASGGSAGGELHNAELHAKKWGYPFPRIDYMTIGKPCSIHWDHTNPAAPIVIYMPLIKNKNYFDGWDPYKANFTSTYNFTYTPEQTALLSGLTSYNMSQSLPLILNTIALWIATKND